MNRYSEKIRQLLVHMIDDDEGVPSHLGAGCGLRHFDAAEQFALTLEARGYLMELSRRGAIPNEQRELIIHYASQMSGEPLDRIDVEELVDHLLLARPGAEWVLDASPDIRSH